MHSSLLIHAPDSWFRHKCPHIKQRRPIIHEDSLHYTWISTFENCKVYYYRFYTFHQTDYVFIWCHEQVLWPMERPSISFMEEEAIPKEYHIKSSTPSFSQWRSKRYSISQKALFTRPMAIQNILIWDNSVKTMFHCQSIWGLIIVL